MALIETGKEKSVPHMEHMQPNLTITLDNRPPIAIPSQIGIGNPLWKVHNLDKYETPEMSMPMGLMPVMASLHTHDNLVIIHIKSIINRGHTLGEVFQM